MSDVQSLYSQARKLILSLRAGVEKIESGATGRQMEQYRGLSADLQKQLNQLQKINSDMEGMWRMQALKSNGKVDMWKRKIDQVAEEAAALQLSLDKCDSRHQSWQVEEDHRKELLHRRVAGLAVTNFDIEAEGRDRVHRSKQVAEEAYQTGVSVLAAMSQQRDRLKSAHRKVLDVLNTIGLSDSVLRVAERRIAVDKLIAYGGMAAVTLILIVLYWWFKP
eukprot:jgi/Picsp_1/198/NSC_00197-R1_golgi snap receptor complex member 2